ncbi:ankyrin repeat domain-containing protein 27 isoform X2 [Lampetra fluviatilis]
MASYDEDIARNPFFLALQRKRPELFRKAAELHAVVLVPCQGSVRPGALSSCPFESYVLLPSADEQTRYVSMGGQAVSLRGGELCLTGGEGPSVSARVLFEETFYTDREESLSLICISRPLDALPPPAHPDAEDSGVSMATVSLSTSCPGGASSGAALQAPASLGPGSMDECREVLAWTETPGGGGGGGGAGGGGSATAATTAARRDVDRRIAVFTASFRQLEGRSLRHHIDAVGALYSKCLQVVLKDPQLKSLARQEASLKLLKQAVEMYVLNGTHDAIFKAIGTMEASQDAAFNKRTRSLQDLQLKDLDITSDLSINIPRAKRVLGQLNRCRTSQEKLLCLRSAVHTVLLSPSHRVNVQAMTTDDLLPILIFLVVKTEIPNWRANLSYVKNLRFSGGLEDELGYCLTSFEAAVEHIHAGILTPGAGGTGLPGNGSPWSSPGGAISRAPSACAIDLLFECVASGRDEEVSRLLTSGEGGGGADAALCHPLCSCDSCERIVSGRLNDPSVVTPFSRNDHGLTPLHVAAQHGRLSLLELLLAAGAVVNTVDYHGASPLHSACSRGHQAAALLLLDRNANPSAEDMSGNTPLHLACGGGHEACVKALVFFSARGRHVDPSAQNDRGDSPLHVAARWGYEPVVASLLEAGAAPDLQNRAGETALTCALNSRVMALIHNSSPHSDEPPDSSKASDRPSPSANRSPDCSSSSRRSSTLSDASSSLSSSATMLETQSDDEKSRVERLLKAVADGDLVMTRFLLGWTDDSDESDTEAFPPMFQLCHPLCQCATCQPQQRRASLLSSSGLSVNASDRDGLTPLHAACANVGAAAQLTSALLRHGADPDVGTHRNGHTPLHTAARLGLAQVADILLEHGAKVNKRDRDGNTPLHLACVAPSALTVLLLVQHGASACLVNRRGDSALHEAARAGSADAVRALLYAGASAAVKNRQQRTPAQLAVEQEVLELLERAEAEERGSEVDGREGGGPRAPPGVGHGAAVGARRHRSVRSLFEAVDEDDYDAERTRLSLASASFDNSKHPRRSPAPADPQDVPSADGCPASAAPTERPAEPGRDGGDPPPPTPSPPPSSPPLSPPSSPPPPSPPSPGVDAVA